jgi:tetratricopeptide (TPR) repeat protein
MLNAECGTEIRKTPKVERRTPKLEWGRRNTQQATRSTQSFSFGCAAVMLLLFALVGNGPKLFAQDFFAQGARAYEAGHYDQAAASFEQAFTREPSVGALENLGNAEWQRGNAGRAILAWERAQWLDPRNTSARENLRFARKTALLDAPELPWYEICSTWLPANAWPWVACGSFWLAAALVMLPGIFRWRKSGWHQAVAAACFAVFLITLPALAGVQTRSELGVILLHDAPLRLTPTADAEAVARLSGGEIARLQRARGDFLFIRTATASGWIERGQFALIARE